MPRQRTLPSLEILKEWLQYDPASGIISWAKKSSQRAKPGMEAGHENACGYRMIRLHGQAYLGHRIAWFMYHGQDPIGMEVDHINHDRSDNRIANLRLVSSGQQAMNRSIKCDNISGIKGLYWIKREQRWRANITKEGKRYQFYSKDKDQVIAWLSQMRQELHGEHACTG